VKGEMAELPRVMAERFVKDYALPEYDATQLTQSKAVAAYFEATAKACGQPKLASNWIMSEVTAFLNRQQIEITNSQLPSGIVLGRLIAKIANEIISNASGKIVFQALCDEGGVWFDDIAEIDSFLDELIDTKSLKQINDTDELEKIIDNVLAANAKNVAEFKTGNAKALNSLVGPIMRASKGKANPIQVNALLIKKLS
jgi:aspartyl-tRNA(Asn)/glutamyl-tRNA(Gln) amidotransferase subunit B